MAYGAHTFWRSRWPARVGSDYVNLYEAVFIDVALNRRGGPSDTDATPIQSGNYGGYILANAFDGNTGTLWSGNPNGDPDGVWIGIEFGSPVSMARFTSSGDGFSCVIEYSDDGSTWTATDTAGTNTALLALDDFVETKATTGHAYWRCQVIQIVGNTYCSLATMDFRDSGGSIDLSGGSAIATQDLGSPYNKEKAFDGDINTFWLSQGQPFAALGYQFATDVLPTELRTTSRNDSYGPGEAWQAFGVQYSDDGVNWTLQLYAEGLSWTAGETKTFDLTFVAAIPEYLHIYRIRSLTWSANGAAISCAEIQFRDTVGGSDVTGSGLPYSKFTNPSYPADRAFDNDTGNFWLSNNANAQIGYNFGVEIALTEYTMQPRNGYADESMKSWVLEASDGEGGWIELDRKTNESANWTSGVMRTFTFDPPDGGGPDPEPTGRRRYSFIS